MTEADTPLPSPPPSTDDRDLARGGTPEHEVRAGGPGSGRGAMSSPTSVAKRRPEGMIPARTRRRTKVERGSMRVLATGGIIGIATLLGAVLVAQDVAGWIVGLAVGLTSVILAAVLWSSRQL